MLVLSNVTKSYTMGENVVHALKGVNLRIEDGEFVAIMGPSGSGKSTLTHILGLLDVPTSGSYELNGNEISHLTEDDLAILRREEIGFVFQQFNLLPRLNAEENVGLPLLYSESNTGSKFPKELLDRVGLGPRAGHRPNELSGGQQQRVAIARSLVNRPRMVLADEPTGNLDSTSEQEILAILKELNTQGITVIIVTHEEDIGKQANRLIRLRDGVVQSDERQNGAIAPFSSKAGPFVRRKVEAKKGASFFTELFAHIGQGFRTLSGNKVRTALSMLGILIGVASVVAMLALGKGAQKAIETQLSSLGSNLLVLHAGAVKVGGVAQQAGATTRLTYEDSLALKAAIPELNEAAASVNGRVQVTWENKNWSTQLLGGAPAYAKMHALVPEIGRFYTETENLSRARVAVIGATVVREVFGGQSPIGEMIKLNKVPFQVIGILPEKGATGWRDQDDIVVIPVATAMYRLLGKLYLDSIEMEVRSATDVAKAQEDALELMLKRKRVPLSQRDDAFDVRNMADIQEALSASSRTMSNLLAAIAAISLLVGGIGIMNIMLVSVTERTKEIGLRKAIGARRADILFQFLAESVVVSFCGGLAGVVLGWVITVAISAATGWSTSVSPESVFLAFGCSAFIGVLFGVYPARKASQLHPIDALRFE
jgi:macrolide transport system ATP-binding/permease protein